MKTVEINLIDLRSPATYNEDTAIQAKRQQFDIRNNSVVLFNKSNLKNVQYELCNKYRSREQSNRNLNILVRLIFLSDSGPF